MKRMFWVFLMVIAIACSPDMREKSSADIAPKKAGDGSSAPETRKDIPKKPGKAAASPAKEPKEAEPLDKPARDALEPRKDTPKKPAEAPASRKKEIKITQQIQKPHGGSMERLRLIIRNKKQWDTLEKESNFIPIFRKETKDLKIDFETQMAIYASMGELGSEGHYIEIVKVYQKGKEIKIVIRENIVQPKEFVLDALSNPYCIAVVEKSDLPVNFIETRNEKGK